MGAGGGGGVIGVSSDDMFARCGDSFLNMDIKSCDHSSGLWTVFILLCDMGETVVWSVRDSPVVFHQHCLQPKLSNTEILEVTGVCGINIQTYNMIWHDMYPATTLTWASCGGARCRGAPSGRALHRIVSIIFGGNIL